MGGKPRVSQTKLSKFFCYSCHHKWEGPQTIRGDTAFSQRVDKCEKCESPLIKETFPDGAVMRPYHPRWTGYCASCGNPKMREDVAITELDGKLYWFCADCRDEHPRSGKFSFSDDSSTRKPALSARRDPPGGHR